MKINVKKEQYYKMLLWFKITVLYTYTFSGFGAYEIFVIIFIVKKCEYCCRSHGTFHVRSFRTLEMSLTFK